MFKTLATAALVANASAANVQQVEKIVAGLLKGAVDAEGFTDIEKCLGDGEAVVKDVETAVADFKKGDTQSIVAGIQQVGAAIQEVHAGMSDCSTIKADWKKLEEMAAIFSNPKELAIHTLKDVMMYKKQISSELRVAVQDYHDGDWFDMGYNFGEAAALAILGKPAQDEIKNARFLQGMTKPFGAHFNVEALLACVGEEDKAALILNAVYGMIQDIIKTKNYQEIIGVVFGAFAAYKQAMQGLPACEAVFESQTWQKDAFQSSMAPVDINKEDLWKLLEKIVIEDLLKKFIQAYAEENYELAGEQMGQLLKDVQDSKKALATPATKLSKRDVAETAQGFLSATNVGDFNFTNLLICIYEADQEAEVLDAAYHMIKEAIQDKDWHEGIGAAIAIAAFVKGLQQVVVPCSQVDTSNSNWTVVDNILETLENKNLARMNENLVLNGRTITKEIVSAISAYEAGNYNTFGKEIGLTLKDTCAKEEPLFLY